MRIPIRKLALSNLGSPIDCQIDCLHLQIPKIASNLPMKPQQTLATTAVDVLLADGQPGYTPGAGYSKLPKAA